MSIAAYASYAPAPWYIDAAVGYAYNWGSLTRTIAFPGIFRTADINATQLPTGAYDLVFACHALHQAVALEHGSIDYHARVEERRAEE